MFSLVCVILISTCICSYSFKIGIKARILDPAGRDASFIYDGGSVEISCWQIGDNGGKTLELEAHNWNEGNYQYFNTNNRKLQHNVSINSRLLSTWYKCKDKEHMRYSGTVRINYVLCNPTPVKPRKVCTKRGEFCHVRNESLAECKSLKKSRCLLGHSSDKISDYQKDTQLLPKFNVVCGTRKTTELGLCRSLAHSPDQLVRFVTNDMGRCDLGFHLSICGKDCKGKKIPTVMTGWDFVDVAKPFSIHIQANLEKTRSSNVSCDIAYTNNEEIMSKNVTFETGNKKSHNAISEQLKQLPTPTIADMVCDVNHQIETFLRYQTNLLVFSSDKDFHYKVKDWVELDGDKKTYKFIINVTAADGLLVCAEKGKGCTPTGATTKKTVVRKVEFRQGDRDFRAFYIGLFASSPKRKYVRIHEKVLQLPTREQNIKTNTAGTGTTTLKPETTKTTGSGSTIHKPEATNTTGSGITIRKPETTNTRGSDSTISKPEATSTTDGGSTIRRPEATGTTGSGSTILKPETTNTTGSGSSIRKPGATRTTGSGSTIRKPWATNTAGGGSTIGEPEAKNTTGSVSTISKPEATNTTGSGSTIRKPGTTNTTGSGCTIRAPGATSTTGNGSTNRAPGATSTPGSGSTILKPGSNYNTTSSGGTICKPLIDDTKATLVSKRLGWKVGFCVMLIVAMLAVLAMIAFIVLWIQQRNANRRLDVDA